MPPSVQADDAGLKAAAAGLRPTTPEKRASRPTNRCEAAAQRHPLRFYGLPPRTGSISPTRAEGIDASRQPALTASDWQGGARRARNKPETGPSPAPRLPLSHPDRRRHADARQLLQQPRQPGSPSHVHEHLSRGVGVLRRRERLDCRIRRVAGENVGDDDVGNLRAGG